MAAVSAGNYTLSRCILAGLVGEPGLNHRRRGRPPTRSRTDSQRYPPGPGRTLSSSPTEHAGLGHSPPPAPLYPPATAPCTPQPCTPTAVHPHTRAPHTRAPPQPCTPQGALALAQTRMVTGNTPCVACTPTLHTNPFPNTMHALNVYCASRLRVLILQPLICAR
jgi:hypothetical protein